MKKKILAVILAMVMIIGCLSGCSMLVSDSDKDMAQVVAEVDISKSQAFQKDGEYAAYKDVIQPSKITKRELVAYFVNAGYSYVMQQGLSYKETFDMLLESMTNYKILVQYATVYFLQNDDAYTVEGYKAAVASAKTDDDRWIASLKYFLNNTADESNVVYTDNNGKKYTRFDSAVNGLKASINSSIDSREQQFIVTAQTASSASSDSRAVPNGVNTAKKDFFDVDYDIYTGLSKTASECGSYEKQLGSTMATRKKAYASFLSMLKTNDLLTEDEQADALSLEAGKGIASTTYYKSELIGQLESAISQKLSDAFDAE
ncbi:MAG: hypothetical protein J6Z36_05030, partial [Clostridia bacterium]|nr:hypothetical protein [Clostridia bacterium]